MAPDDRPQAEGLVSRSNDCTSVALALRRRDGRGERASRVGASELLGRDDELAQLYAVIDGIGQRGGALVVRGEAGIGKSALLEAASRAGSRAGGDGRLDDRDGPEARLAFAGLHRLLMPFPRRARPSARAAAPGARDGGRPRRRRGSGSVPDRAWPRSALLTDTEPKRPLLLVVEDAQWLDGPSAEVLGFVARRLEHEPVIVLFAVREGVASAVRRVRASGARASTVSTTSLRRRFWSSTSPDLPARPRCASPRRGGREPARADRASRRRRASTETRAPPLPRRLEQAFATRIGGLDLRDPPLAPAGRAGGRRASRGLRAAPPGRPRWRPGSARLERRHVPVPASTDPVGGGAGGDAGGAPASACRARRGASRTSPTAPSGTGQPWQDQGPDEEVARGPRRRSRASPASRRARRRAGRATNGRRSSPAIRPERALRLFRAGELAFELGRPTDSERLLRAAQQLGLPPQERALAAFDVESLEPTWSGAATVGRLRPHRAGARRSGP